MRTNNMTTLATEFRYFDFECPQCHTGIKETQDIHEFLVNLLEKVGYGCEDEGMTIKCPNPGCGIEFEVVGVE